MTWSIRAFAGLTGVTVKALHHYERRGLLTPRRSNAGYRRYSLADLARLERVLALKSLGFPLAQVAMLMDDPEPTRGRRAKLARRTGSSSLAAPGRPSRAALVREQRTQRAALRDRLDRAIETLDAIDADAQPAAAIDRFVREAAWARWEAKRSEMASPATRAPDRASPSRVELFREISGALERDRSGTTAAPLAARWRALIEAEAEGNPKTVAALRQVAASRRHWPDGARRYIASLYDADVDTWERVMTFVERADA